MKATLRSLIEEFRQGRMGIRSWLTMRNMKIYVRVTRRSIEGRLVESLDVSSAEVAERYRGKGLFTRWLTKAEMLAAQNGLIVFAESILEPRLLGFLEKRGYRRLNDSQPICMVKESR